jgi:hypothetical protein
MRLNYFLLLDISFTCCGDYTHLVNILLHIFMGNCLILFGRLDIIRV